MIKLSLTEAPPWLAKYHKFASYKQADMYKDLLGGHAAKFVLTKSDVLMDPALSDVQYLMIVYENQEKK